MNIDDVPELEEGFDSRKRFPVATAANVSGAIESALSIENALADFDADDTGVRRSRP